MITLTELFKDVLEKTEDFNLELVRLSNIEKKIKDNLEEKKEEIKGLEKALTYASISSPARDLIKDNLLERQKSINSICYFLGIERIYKEIK